MGRDQKTDKDCALLVDSGQTLLSAIRSLCLLPIRIAFYHMLSPFSCLYSIYPMIIISGVFMRAKFRTISLDPSETFRLRICELYTISYGLD